MCDKLKRNFHTWNSFHGLGVKGGAVAVKAPPVAKTKSQ